MLMYPADPLSEETEAWLSDRRQQVNAEPSRAARHRRARDLFANKRTRAFNEIRRRLAAMSPPGDACFYCEQDRRRDIDHIRPLRHYPEQGFDWQNYVYACAICNQDAKQDRCAIIDDQGALIHLDRSWPDDKPLPPGIYAQIDIRRENPLDFLAVEFDTGWLVPIAEDGIARQRAVYTRDLFRLDQDVLSRARRQAFHHFCQHLELLAKARDAGDKQRAKHIENEIRELPHPTVLAEMRRQSSSQPKLAALMRNLPPDLGGHTVRPLTTGGPA
jgi:uncharacterized protein (TIGR02646 family)